MVLRGKRHFKAPHYSPTISKSEGDKIIDLYVTSYPDLSRSELVIKSDCFITNCNVNILLMAPIMYAYTGNLLYLHTVPVVVDCIGVNIL